MVVLVDVCNYIGVFMRTDQGLTCVCCFVLLLCRYPVFEGLPSLATGDCPSNVEETNTCGDCPPSETQRSA